MDSIPFESYAQSMWYVDKVIVELAIGHTLSCCKKVLYYNKNITPILLFIPPVYSYSTLELYMEGLATDGTFSILITLQPSCSNGIICSDFHTADEYEAMQGIAITITLVADV